VVKLVSNKILVGVDIGGTKTAVVLSSCPPTILERVVFPTAPENGYEHALQHILDAIREALLSQHLEVSDLASIGVSCGGPLDPVNGVIQSPPNLPSWNEVPIKSILERELNVKCLLENDANAGALAEYRFGAGRGTKNMAFLTMGTGLGAGLILNGQLYRGATYAAGEIGHVRLTRSGPSGYNKVGTAEGWASGAGMARAARGAIRRARASGEATILHSVRENNNNNITAQDIWLAAQSGDAVAQRIVNTTGRRLGETMAILIDLLNPECIVVGGLATRMGGAILGPARTVVETEALPASVSACKIVAAGLGERVGDVAALCVAMEEQHCEG
jgi:glucokinase